eukprot:scaffold63711_cov30-Phaeocystis_antarctica.AAC.3
MERDGQRPSDGMALASGTHTPARCLLPSLVAQHGARQRDVGLQQQIEQRAPWLHAARVATAH